MKIGPMRVPIGNPDPLSPPVTTEEVGWWKEIRGPIVLRYFLQVGVPMTIVLIASNLLAHRHSERGLAFTVLLMGLGGILTTLVHFKLTEKALREQEVRWKRLRDDLTADADDIAKTHAPE